MVTSVPQSVPPAHASQGKRSESRRTGCRPVLPSLPFRGERMNRYKQIAAVADIADHFRNPGVRTGGIAGSIWRGGACDPERAPRHWQISQRLGRTTRRLRGSARFKKTTPGPKATRSGRDIVAAGFLPLLGRKFRDIVGIRDWGVLPAPTFRASSSEMSSPGTRKIWADPKPPAPKPRPNTSRMARASKWRLLRELVIGPSNFLLGEA